MKQYLFKSILPLGAVLGLVSCNEEISLDSEDITPGGNSDKICFVVSDKSASRGGSPESRRCGGAYLHNGTDSIFLGLTVAEQSDMPASRASYITEADYNPLRVTCRRRIESNTYDYYFSNIPFSKDATGTWVSDPSYWWLDANTHFIFYGYAPADAKGVKYIRDEQTWEPKLDYEVPAEVKSQCDLVYNTITQEYVANENITVPLSMTHALANVAFKTGTGMAAGTITKVTVKNVLGHGTLNLTNGKWTLDQESATDFVATIGKESSDNTDITTDTDKTYFMLLPGSNSEATGVEIEFTKADGTTASYSGTLPSGTTWEAGKQYLYIVTIDPDIFIELENPNPQDAHYVICKATVNTANMQPGQQWELTVSADDGADASVLADADLNDYQKLGFWTDKVWLQDVNDTAPHETAESSRGSNTLTGSGDTPISIFLPENIGDTDRTITLTLKVDGGKNIVSQQKITQQHPNWTSNNFGWEQIEEDPEAQWGFKWNRVVTYEKANIIWNAFIYYPIIKDLVTQYNAEFYTTVDHNGQNWRPVGMWGKTTIEIDYKKLNNLSTLDLTESNGLDNTQKLYGFSGAATTGNLEQAIKNLANRGQNGVFNPINESGTDNITAAALRYILRKNKYNWVEIKKEDNGTIVTTASAVIYQSDIKWFLPAKNQFQFAPIAVPLSGEYWSSTPDGNDNAFTSSGTAERQALRKVRACRMKQ